MNYEYEGLFRFYHIVTSNRLLLYSHPFRLIVCTFPLSPSSLGLHPAVALQLPAAQVCPVHHDTNISKLKLDTWICSSPHHCPPLLRFRCIYTTGLCRYQLLICILDINPSNSSPSGFLRLETPFLSSPIIPSSDRQSIHFLRTKTVTYIGSIFEDSFFILLHTWIEIYLHIPFREYTTYPHFIFFSFCLSFYQLVHSLMNDNCDFVIVVPSFLFLYRSMHMVDTMYWISHSTQFLLSPAFR